ncbi:MAG: FecR domain-containing protein [Muribaculaceae bacterium]|nr:FecR domain-containing protein [Muribaculaceae bacterium]
MKKTDIDINTYRQIVNTNEPHLKANEQDEMWQNIEQQISSPRQSIFNFKKIMVAASIAAIIIGSVFILNINSNNIGFTQLAKSIEISKLDNIVLQIGDQHIDLADNVRVKCDASSHQIEILKDSISLFSFAVADASTPIQIAVPAGKNSSVILSDNSEITLNTQSQLIFPFEFAGTERNVYLEGEAYFHVSHNKEKRFTATTKSLDISVLGTEFIVSAYPQEGNESVTLVSGKVQINTLDTNEEVILNPKDRFTYTKVSSKSRLEQQVETETLIYWTENIINAENESLSNVLPKIEKYYNIKLEYDSTELSEIRLEGKLDISVDISEILERIAKIAPITIDKKNKSTYIIKLTNP